VQDVQPAAAPKNTRLILLGTQGGPRVNADRAQSASEPDSSYVEGVKEFYSGPVVVGRDLLEF